MHRQILLRNLVSIPSNGSSLFQFKSSHNEAWLCYRFLSQSPQTGQVYFNPSLLLRLWRFFDLYGLNPLKRVKFISMLLMFLVSMGIISGLSQSPQTGQVYFNSIPIFATTCLPRSGLNPLKRVKFISIRPNFRVRIRSNLSLNPLKRVKFISMQYAPTLSPIVLDAVSQSPQTGQVYFNWIQIARILNSHSVSIPSNGSSLFQSNS